jgi:LPXTG-motif cell wall-anchored protein
MNGRRLAVLAVGAMLGPGVPAATAASGAAPPKRAPMASASPLAPAGSEAAAAPSPGAGTAAEHVATPAPGPPDTRNARPAATHPATTAGVPAGAPAASHVPVQAVRPALTMRHTTAPPHVPAARFRRGGYTQTPAAPTVPAPDCNVTAGGVSCPGERVCVATRGTLQCFGGAACALSSAGLTCPTDVPVCFLVKGRLACVQGCVFSSAGPNCVPTGGVLDEPPVVRPPTRPRRPRAPKPVPELPIARRVVGVTGNQLPVTGATVMPGILAGGLLLAGGFLLRRRTRTGERAS